MSKVSVIGAGNVGATCANALANMQFASEIVLLDIKEGFAEGKAKDMMQTAKLYRFFTQVKGVTNDYEATANSDVVVITSGIPRKPGMTREELIGTNARIVLNVVDNVLKYSPNAVLVIVSNPMDTMTYLTLKKTGLPKNRVIGMGGILDGSRFTDYLSIALNVPSSDIEGMVIGGHGDTTMIPLARFASYKGIPVSNLLTEDELGKVIANTMVGGATLTKLLGTSAWYAPGAAAAVLVKSIILDEKRAYACCVSLEGEYNQNDICIGVPVTIGKTGWEKIIEFDLNEEEKTLFKKSADSVRSTNNILYESKVL
ncbi:MAG: malate dehydrogenase [Bacteroidales bacterium]|jgi:malate dehydrogenase|nr:malate dehydrogenase [Bacteroidales bacterium]MDD3299648.1 malate dehydrogenase [Bacteroidales bacterium]MDD3843628.1 malate dehydrogenase [Bacteroidales bacterium]MDD4618498.1 malate dehydrogenase [Bacteroidales bacterium]